MTGIQAQDFATSILFGILGRFFAFLNGASKLTSKKHRKKYENKEFGPPSQNSFKIEGPPKTMIFVHFST